MSRLATPPTAMILAAGLGKRMYPLTEHTPKPLVRLRGKPLIEHTIEALVAAGVQRIVINISHLAEAMLKQLGDGSRWQIQIDYSHEEAPLETGGGILKALPLLGDDAFLVVSGDLYTDYPYRQLLQRPVTTGHLVLVPNPPHHPTGDYGLTQGHLTFSAAVKYNFAGIARLHPSLFQESAVAPLGPTFKLATLLSPLIVAGALTGEIYPGLWHNVGTPEQLAALDI